MSGVRGRQAPIVMVIDFHHARGPEIELCIGEEDIDVVTKNDWSLLPFMALSDGAHAYEVILPFPIVPYKAKSCD
jgi:hypothetical protein